MYILASTQFSMAKSDYKSIWLEKEDIGRIMDLERKTCIPLIQASEETILKRFDLGNLMLGIEESQNRELIGSMGMRYAKFSPEDYASFPKIFREFSTPEMPVRKDYNSIFVYSFNVSPSKRRKGEGFIIARSLFDSLLEKADREKCRYIVGDGRPASYNGSPEGQNIEWHKQIPEFKDSIDKYLRGGQLPTKEEILLEPTIKVYHRLIKGFNPLWIIPNFFSNDAPAGGLRIILCKDLAKGE